MVRETLYDLVQGSLQKYPSNIAYSMFEREDVTYKEVGERIAQVQQTLREAGLSSGDKVVILSSNMPNWGVCYFAVTTAGMVAVPILPDFSNEELDMLIAHSEAKALLVSDKLYTRISKEVIESLNIVIRTKNLLTLRKKEGVEEGTTTPPKPQDLAVILYTSGTTSKPKGVMLTHHNLVEQCKICEELFAANEHDSFLSVLPLSHTYESSLGLIFPMSAGARVTYLDRPPTASTLLPAFKKVRPTVLLIVPLIIEKIFRAQVQAKFNSTAFWRTICKVGFIRNYLYKVAGNKLNKVFGGRVRFMGIGGAKLDSQTEEFLHYGRIKYGIGYGLTETAPLLSGAVPGKTKLGSAGFAPSSVTLRLDNVDPVTKQGEIVAQTPCVMRGYYKNEEATRETFTEDGWFRTGDIGYIDETGRLYLKGRLKNMILGPSGENIYPEEIENVLNSHVYITESLVTEKEGRLVALVYFDTDAIEAKFEELREEWEAKKGELEQYKEEVMRDIREYVNAKVNRFSKISEVVEEKEEFIKTPTLKIKRYLYKDGKRVEDVETQESQDGSSK
ncbi:MAG: AMP-binding protein [Rikenellaceae bacterium]